MLTIHAATITHLRDQATRGYPEEVCGLLLGQADVSGQARIVAARAIDNLRRDRAGDRFELDPKQHLRVQREARQRGWRVVGVYHSHPDAAAVPSATDRARACEIWGRALSWAYVIVAVRAAGVDSIRSWLLRGGQFEEQTIKIVEMTEPTEGSD
jgi:proteasome lid subunit RPN8/RPN11